MPKPRVVDFGSPVIDVAGHFDFLYGTTEGYAIIGRLDRRADKKTIEQHEYRWPVDRQRMVDDVMAFIQESGVDVFCCPYLMNTQLRAEGNAVAHRLVHVDIDRDVRRDERAWLRSMGFRLVESGTPGHVQAFGRLSRVVGPAEHRGIEEALRERCGGDHKIADNDFMRIPGATNWKNGNAVILVNQGRRVDVDTLVDTLGATPKERQANGHVPWQVVQGKIPPRVRALMREDVPEGLRSEHIWRVVRSLAESGMDRDQIHTALHEWPLGVDKYGARWHRQIDDMFHKREVVRFEPGENFWNRRGVLTHIRQHALAVQENPWAVLGVVMTYVLHAIPPGVWLPALGPCKSLNLFVGLVGESGAGKAGAMVAAADALRTGFIVRPHPLGSGEGIAKAYAYRGKDGKVVNRATSVLFQADEVATFNALGSRNGATLLPELCKGWSGQLLGFGNADETRTVPVDADTYRMGLVVGIQPEMADKLIGEVSSGTPQRFLWLPVQNEAAPDVEPDVPDVMDWEIPVLPDLPYRMGVPDSVREELRDRRRRVHRKELRVDPFDSQLPALKLKVAGALALMDGRIDQDEEDWELAGRVCTVSARERDTVRDALTRKRRAVERARGEMEAERDAAKEKHAQRINEEATIAKLKRLIGSREQVSHTALLKRWPNEKRDAVDAVLARLVKSGEIKKTTGEYRGRETVAYSTTGM